MQVIEPVENPEFGDFDEVSVGTISLNECEEFGHTSDDTDPYDMVEAIGGHDADYDPDLHSQLKEKGWL